MNHRLLSASALLLGGGLGRQCADSETVREVRMRAQEVELGRPAGAVDDPAQRLRDVAACLAAAVPGAGVDPRGVLVDGAVARDEGLRIHGGVRQQAPLRRGEGLA